jgi:hypothetical protein
MARFPDRRHWDGRTVHVTTNTYADRRSVEAGMTPETAGALANLLRSHTGLANLLSPLPDELQELMVALDYVMVADPSSVAAHRRMEASKGMDPAESNPPALPRPLRDTDTIRTIPHRYVEASRAGHCGHELENGSLCSARPQDHEGYEEPTDPGLRALRKRRTTEAGQRLGTRYGPTGEFYG